MALDKLSQSSTLKQWRERINQLIDDVTRYAVKNHASTDRTFGIATTENYGHVKLVDDPNLTMNAESGIAPSALAMQTVYIMANNSIQKGEAFNGNIEATKFIGYLEGTSSNADVATNAINDEFGHNIIATYATKTEIADIINGVMYAGSLKRSGTSIQWKDILTDTNSSFLYQTSYTGYMPALNLQTQDGRVGFGTYQDFCRWSYFNDVNETNNPDAYIDLSAQGVDVKGTFTVTETTTCNSNLNVKGTTTLSNLNVSGVSNFNNNATFNGNVAISKPLTVSGTATFNNSVSANTLNVTGKIHGGAGSNFNTDLYVNSSTNSLIIRNDGSNTYLLVGDSVGAGWNSLRPFAFNMSSGAVTMSHAVNMNSTLYVKGNIVHDGTITGGKVHNAVFNDYAEFFEKGEDTEIGDIISLDLSSDEERYIKASKDNPTIVGVHSDTYGHILGGTNDIEESEKTHIPVGLVGRVKTKIVGKIKKGEFVVLSGIPGVGCAYDEKLNTPLDVFGVAVESSDDIDIKLVKIKLK